MNTTTGYMFDNSGVYMGKTPVQFDPVLGTPMLPKRTTLVAPPHKTAGLMRVWDGHKWELKSIANAPAPYIDQLAAEIRTERNLRLCRCDWTQLADVPFDLGKSNAWALYRQHLRDVPQQGGFPHSINWPNIPSL